MILKLVGINLALVVFLLNIASKSYCERNKFVGLEDCVKLYNAKKYEQAENCFRIKYFEDSLISKRFERDKYIKLIVKTIVKKLIDEKKKVLRGKFGPVCHLDYIGYEIEWRKLFERKNRINIDNSIAKMNIYLPLKENDPYFLYLLGKLYSYKDKKQSIKYLRKSVDLMPDNFYAINLLMSHLREQIESMDSVIEKRKIVNEIVDLNRLFLNIRPNSIHGYKILASLYLFHFKEFKKGINLSEEIIRLNTNYYQAYINIGFIYLMLKKYEKSVNHLEKGYRFYEERKEFDPYARILTPLGIKIDLAKAYEGIGEKKKALEIYKEYIKKHPRGTPTMTSSSLKSKIEQLENDLDLCGKKRKRKAERGKGKK